MGKDTDVHALSIVQVILVGAKKSVKDINARCK